MNTTVANLRDDLEGLLHGANLNNLHNFYGLLYRASSRFLLDCDPEGTKRVTNITNAIYNKIYNYSAPSDLKDVIDIRPQVGRVDSESYTKVSSRDFDRYKSNYTFAIERDSTVNTLKISASQDSGTTLHTLDSLTSNGTWSGGGDATNVTSDDDNYVAGSASVNFDVDGSGTTAYLENSDFSDIDIEDEEDKAGVFVWVYMPDSDKVTNWILRWGSGSSAYWSNTVTSPHTASSFEDGWNLLRFDWNGASETGSPDSSAVDYLRITVTYDGTADTDFRVDSIMAKVGDIYELSYYSKYLFRDSSGEWLEKATSNTDLFNLDTDAYDVFLSLVAYRASQQIAGSDSTFDYTVYKKEYDDGVEQYRRNHPSEALKEQKTYYTL